MNPTTDTYERAVIWLIAVCWVVIALSYFNIEGSTRYAADQVAELFLTAGVFTMAFTILPWSKWLYTLAGAFSTTALLARCVSVIIGFLATDTSDGKWISMSGVATTFAFMLVYWWLWLREVRPLYAFHNQLRIDRKRFRKQRNARVNRAAQARGRAFRARGRANDARGRAIDATSRAEPEVRKAANDEGHSEDSVALAADAEGRAEDDARNRNGETE